jgi:c-di-GMP-binding flagellar brake protein YcgR
MSEPIYTADDIHIADPVELRVTDANGRTVRRYKSLVQDLNDEGIAVSMPTYQGRPVPLKSNHMVEVSIFRGFTTHLFVSRVLRRVGGKRPALLLSKPPGRSIRRIPRRDYFRVDTEIEVQISGWDLQNNKSVQQALLNDLSVGGCRLVVHSTLPIEGSVELDFELPLPASEDGMDLPAR